MGILVTVVVGDDSLSTSSCVLSSLTDDEVREVQVRTIPVHGVPVYTTVYKVSGVVVVVNIFIKSHNK